nr:Eco57I restriction-modification methylase domain-containing protein [Campylobacter concisus]
MDKGSFNVLIANPPYSVKGFLTTLKDDKNFDKYELSKVVETLETNNAIECFFVERAAQILDKDGVCGIVLPSSLINKTGKIYEKTREILLGNFEIIAISEFGNKTFGKTGTNTVILFLRRLANKPNALVHAKNRAVSVINDSSFLAQYNDRLNLGEYCEFMGYDKNKYKKFITQKVLLENEIFNEYEIAFKNSSEYKSIIKKKNLSEKEKEEQISNKMIEFIKGIEIDKFSIFQLVNYQNTLIIKAPNDNEEQKKFLGYDWSNAKGNEGIKYITDVAASGDDDETIENIKKISSIKTTLYDPAVLDNPEKLNFIIREAFDGKLKQFNENLKPYANLVNLRDCIDFRRASFDKAINLSAKSKVEITSKYPMVKLGTLLNTIETGSRPNGGVGNLNEGALSLGGEHIHNTNGIINLVNPKFVSIEYYENNQKGRLKQNDILLCKDGALTGKIALLRDELNNRRAMVNEHIFILRAADIITQKYIFYFLYSPLGQQILKQNITGAAQGGLNSTNLKNIRIPFSNNKENKKVFQKIVAECEKVDKEFKTIRMEIGELKAKMSEIFTKFGISFNSNGGGMS